MVNIFLQSRETGLGRAEPGVGAVAPGNYNIFNRNHYPEPCALWPLVLQVFGKAFNETLPAHSHRHRTTSWSLGGGKHQKVPPFQLVLSAENMAPLLLVACTGSVGPGSRGRI